MSDTQRPDRCPPDWRQRADDEKLMLLMARFPDAAAVGRFLDEHERLVEEQERRKWVFGFIRTAALWMTAVAGAIAIIRGMWADLKGPAP